MQVSSVLDSSPVTSSSSQQTSDSTSSFAGYFLDASDTASSTSNTSGGDQVDDAVKEFMDYAKETPEQRLFNNWLGSQGISEQDYKAMSPAQQQALHDKFAQQLQDKLKDNTLGSFNVAIATSLSAPASKNTLTTAAAG